MIKQTIKNNQMKIKYKGAKEKTKPIKTSKRLILYRKERETILSLASKQRLFVLESTCYA